MFLYAPDMLEQLTGHDGQLVMYIFLIRTQLVRVWGSRAKRVLNTLLSNSGDDDGGPFSYLYQAQYNYRCIIPQL